MKTYELLLACRDEADVSAKQRRKKEGDVIAIKPYPWQWGRKETAGFLVVPVLTDMSKKELMGLVEHGGKDKRRFQIPLDILTGWLPGLDFGRVRDKEDHYQPFKEQGIVVDMTEKVAVVKDKTRGTFKYGNRKTATE